MIFRHTCVFFFFFKKNNPHLHKGLVFSKPLSENMELAFFFFHKSVYGFMQSYLSIFTVKIESQEWRL